MVTFLLPISCFNFVLINKRYVGCPSPCIIGKPRPPGYLLELIVLSYVQQTVKKKNGDNTDGRLYYTSSFLVLLIDR
jgi:hypothetical protein